MKEFEVYAGWLEKPELIGKCNIENARGNEVISFSYEEKWLHDHEGFIFDPDICERPGRQYPPAGKPCFGFLSDMAPDRWGRKLLKCREAIKADEDGRAHRTLLESDYILGVCDEGRIGGIRLYDAGRQVYLHDSTETAVLPMKKLRDLEEAAIRTESGDLHEKRRLTDLIAACSSLGGARPKANVTDENGDIWIAKFPSVNDDHNIGAWEMVAHELAVRCGIHVPEARLMNLSSYGSTFLIRRFDRKKDRRILYASAMNMLGQTDDSTDDVGYIDIAEVIERIGGEPEHDLKELWRRMVFNICISNTDDHLRNHGFILTENGWRLSGAFDVNPCTDKDEMSLLIYSSRRKDVNEAVEAAELFRISRDSAEEQVTEITRMISRFWRSEAARFHISTSEQNAMSGAFRQM